jgi:hypothetical protein
MRYKRPEERGAFVYRAMVPHRCDPPCLMVDDFETPFPDGNRGDVWQCADCQKLWVMKRTISGNRWRKAGWRTRQRFR